MWTINSVMKRKYSFKLTMMIKGFAQDEKNKAMEALIRKFMVSKMENS